MPQTINNMVQEWVNSLTTYTAIKMNIPTDVSAAGSLLMDLQVGGSSRFSVSKAGALRVTNGTTAAPAISSVGATNVGFNFSNQFTIDFVTGGSLQAQLRQGEPALVVGPLWAYSWASSAALTPVDLFLTRRAAANLRLGAADAAAPVAQTLSVQSGTAGASALSCSISGTTLTVGGAVTGTIAIGHAVTGTGVSAGTVITAGSGTTWTVNNSQTVSSTTMYFNSVGQNLTITGSQGSGPSAGGSIVFQVAPAGTAGTTAQNALVDALTIGPTNRQVTVHGWLQQTGNVVTFGNGSFGNYFGAAGLEVNQSIGISSGAMTSNSPDVILRRDDANKLALRNGANAQFLRVYSTYTDASNYERGAINTGADFVELAAETAGTGDDNLDVRLTPAGTGNVRFGTHTATADTAVSGYIEIKDAGGTIRKLAVIT